MKTRNILFASLSLFILTGCNGNSQSPSSSRPDSREDKDSKTSVKSDAGKTDSTDISDIPSQGKKGMVVYFSTTNHTENVAKAVSDHLSYPLFKLEPVNPYTSQDLNYSNPNSRVSKEHNDPNRHVELKNVTFDGFESAEYVFLGAPVWWQQLSWVIDDFVSQNDFRGKTVIPFGTSASSSFTVDHLKELAPDATWASPKRFSSSAGASSVNEWLDGLDYSF